MPPYQNNNHNDLNGHTPQPLPPQPPIAGPSPAQPAPNGPAFPSPAQPPSGTPAQQSPAQPSDANNASPYDFFMNPPKQSRPTMFGGSSNKQLMLIAGGLVAVIFIIVVIIAAGSGGKTDTTPLLSVAQAQEEVIRVANDGVKNNQDSNLQNFSVNTVAAVTSAQQQIIALMLKQGIKPSDKQLKLTASAQTDQALAAALAASSYDTTYKTIMQSNLDNYENRLDNASAVAVSKTTRAILQQQHDDALLLEKQLNE